MSKKLNIIDCKGENVGEYVLPDNCLEFEKGNQAVHEAVVAFLAEQRAGTACTKTRGKVRGGGAKPFKQKGLGRARTGSIRNPIWTGGGTIFGPTPRSFSKKVNKKALKLALKRAFSARIEEGCVVVIDQFDIPDGKTKSAQTVFKQLEVKTNALLVVPEYEEKVICATGNIDSVVLRKGLSINVYELLRFDKLIFTKDALDAFLGRLG